MENQVTRRDQRAACNTLGIIGPAAEFLATRDAAHRHHRRMDDTAAILQQLNEESASNEGVVKLLLDVFGIGGRYNLEGLSTIRLPPFDTLGKGRKNASDGSAWMNAARDLLADLEIMKIIPFQGKVTLDEDGSTIKPDDPEHIDNKERLDGIAITKTPNSVQTPPAILPFTSLLPNERRWAKAFVSWALWYTGYKQCCVLTPPPDRSDVFGPNHPPLENIVASDSSSLPEWASLFNKLTSLDPPSHGSGDYRHYPDDSDPDFGPSSQALEAASASTSASASSRKGINAFFKLAMYYNQHHDLILAQHLSAQDQDNSPSECQVTLTVRLSDGLPPKEQEIFEGILRDLEVKMIEVVEVLGL
jgi:hypothetical protein